MEIVDEKGFGSISVQDVTARAGINRATFYAHFPDKYALLDYAIGESFRKEIEQRTLNVCEFQMENLRTLIVTVCEFVGKIHSHTNRQEQFQTLAEAEIRNQVYALILHWMEKIKTISNCTVSRERAATAASWALYGLDISARKRAEKSLRQAQAQLADRAGQLEQAVSERTAELIATNKQLETFIYSVAHDLRAPLRAMRTFSSMLVQENGETLSEYGREYARRINRAAHFMDALLTGMLDFSRMSQQRLALAPVNLKTAIGALLPRLKQDGRDEHDAVYDQQDDEKSGEHLDPGVIP